MNKKTAVKELDRFLQERGNYNKEAVEEAIAALITLTARKPVKIRIGKFFKKTIYICPKCGNDIKKRGIKKNFWHCQKCDQRIDWSGSR